MTYVVVLVCARARPALAPDLAEAVRTALEGTQPNWLEPGIACEIALPAGFAEPESAQATARRVLAGHPVDIAVVPCEHRCKRLLVADMDSTIIGQECIDELADLVGLKAHVAAITERAMRGEIAFEPALRERVALLAGIDLATIRRLLDERISVNPGARTLVSTMRANGGYTALVSGGFTLFTAEVAAMVGFDENRANELLVDGDRLIGQVREPILGRDAKRLALRQLTARLGIDPRETLAVGDGANDLDMLGAAGLGVAYRAKPAVAAAADVRIDHADLTALLFLQGYKVDAFVD